MRAAHGADPFMCVLKAKVEGGGREGTLRQAEASEIEQPQTKVGVSAGAGTLLEFTKHMII